MNMHIRQLAIIGIITLALTPTAFADGVAQAVDGLESDVDTLDSQVSALQTENAALQAVIISLTAVVTTQTAIVDSLVEQQRCHTRPGDLQADENGEYAGGVNWYGCDKTGLSMRGPLWGGAETEALVNADLRFVNFTLANIWGVPIWGNLEGAVFKNANLAGSDLSGANIIGPDGAQYGKTPTVFINTLCPDGANSDDVGETCADNRTEY